MTGRGGFSTVEAIVAITVLAVILSALLVGLFDLQSGAAEARLRSIAEELAQDQLEEILATAFEDPDSPPGSFGAEEGSRIAYDDVDDFHGLVQSPPTAADGTPVPGAAAFTRSIAVENVTSGDLDAVAAAGSTDFKRISVTVTWPGGGSVVVRSLKARQIPLGPATTGIGFVYVGGTRDNAGMGKAKFDLLNATGQAVALTALEAVWSEPMAYYEEIRLDVGGPRNGEVWDYKDAGSVRAASGDVVVFTRSTPFVVPEGGVVEVLLRHFRPDQTGGGGGHVDVDGAAFEITLYAGTIEYPYCSVPPRDADEDD